MRSAVVLLALAFAACGDEPAPTPTPEPVATAVGCGKYCQQAGGYGGGEDGEYLMRVETKGAVPLTDGALAVELTCLTADPCRGAILLSDRRGYVGRGDMVVDGKATRTIPVPLFKRALKAIDKAGRLRVTIFADYGNPDCPPGSVLPCVAFADVTVTKA
jgi:hypothetical protein